MPANPLSLPEREEIRAGIARGETLARIAGDLGRHRCTVSAEVTRNGGRNAYRAIGADAQAACRRRRPKDPKLVADADLAWHVTKRLMAKDSPMTISIELARGVHGVSAELSHECIYQAVYAAGRRGLARGLHTNLHRRRPRRRARRGPGEPTTKASPLGAFNPIIERPAVALTRSEVGHLEGDLICGAANGSAIITVFDRMSRKVWLAGFEGRHDADATKAGLDAILALIPCVGAEFVSLIPVGIRPHGKVLDRA